MEVINEYDELLRCAREWIDNGKFVYNGLAYTRGINDWSAITTLRILGTLPLTDLAFHFDTLMTTQMGQAGIPAKGFSVGNGKALYWYITPTQNGMYKCYRQYDNGEVGLPRYLSPSQIVKLHYQ